ncbi:hypothetical protein GJU39_21660 [Pedobacter petrophilus]|uniref:Carboxypeptidase-like regulatory domain-containing protein n=1 Tax=Pedobacter petrophilus TaxID=1908241 RepID=A0A7K0G5E7_9SPHI|nr:hypothetical protein [Pedobacter petrophilus]MRX78690.1 hypothetical protein [Pedobacter petrophilus]
MEKPVSIAATDQRLSTVLTNISRQGGFHFSYSGKNFPKDSLVTFIANNQAVSKILKQLLNNRYEFEERRNYIIITPALQRLSFINTDVNSDNNTYSISGVIVNETTGERLMNTSVYEKEQLVSTMSDEHGYFKLKLRSGSLNQVRIIASKYAYRDTSLNFLNTVVIANRTRARVFQHDTKTVEATALGRFFTTAAQRIQSINIQDFFANRPYQVSIIPGLSSHGALSSQVINKFSLNLAGGYTAGVDGLEFGGLFNINKRNTRYLQLAGIFNLVGGKVTGLQLAGVSNQALDTLKGIQISGFINKTDSEVSGLQVAVLNNKAHMLKGVQVGIVNVADTSQGASIGLINIIRNGFYKITYSANNLTNTNVSLKTGTHGFYSNLLLGANINAHNKMYSFGFGVGHDFMFSDHIYLSAEAAYQFAFTGSMDDRWAQAKLLLNMQLAKNVSLVAGPTYNKYSFTGSGEGYQSKFKLSGDYRGAGNPVKRWIGWEAGIAFNSVFKPVTEIKKARRSKDLFLGIAALAGWAWDSPSTYVLGSELFMQKDFGDSMSGTLSAGYVYHAVDNNLPGGSFITYPDGKTDEYLEVEYKAIPLKAGIRAYTGTRFFFAGELGVSLGLNKSSILKTTYPNGTVAQIQYGSKNPFLYAISAGYSFNNGLETGIKFEDYISFKNIKQFNLRVAYRFKL